jgi:hypothetical protein
MVFQAFRFSVFTAPFRGLNYLLVFEYANVKFIKVWSAVGEPNFQGVLLK